MFFSVHLNVICSALFSAIHGKQKSSVEFVKGMSECSSDTVLIHDHFSIQKNFLNGPKS